MDAFETELCLGVGAFGKVYWVTYKSTDEKYALKIMNSNQLTRQDLWKQIFNEILILSKCEHENVIWIYGVFESDSDLCLLLELSEGQNLFKILKEI